MSRRQSSASLCGLVSGIYSGNAGSAAAPVSRAAFRDSHPVGWGGCDAVGLPYRGALDAGAHLVGIWQARYKKRNRVSDVHDALSVCPFLPASAGWPTSHGRRARQRLPLHVTGCEPIPEAQRHDLRWLAEHRWQPDDVAPARTNDPGRRTTAGRLLRPCRQMAGLRTSAGRARKLVKALPFRPAHRARVGDPSLGSLLVLQICVRSRRQSPGESNRLAAVVGGTRSTSLFGAVRASCALAVPVASRAIPSSPNETAAKVRGSVVRVGMRRVLAKCSLMSKRPGFRAIYATRKLVKFGCCGPEAAFWSMPSATRHCPRRIMRTALRASPPSAPGFRSGLPPQAPGIP